MSRIVWVKTEGKKTGREFGFGTRRGRRSPLGHLLTRIHLFLLGNVSLVFVWPGCGRSAALIPMKRILPKFATGKFQTQVYGFRYPQARWWFDPLYFQNFTMKRLQNNVQWPFFLFSLCSQMIYIHVFSKRFVKRLFFSISEHIFCASSRWFLKYSTEIT